MRLPIPLYGKSKTDNINAQKAKLVSQIFCANVPNMLCFTAQYMHTLLFCSCCTMYMRIHCTGIFPRASQLKVCPGCGIRQDCDRIGCFGRYRRYSFRIALRHSSAYKIRPETARWVWWDCNRGLSNAPFASLFARSLPPLTYPLAPLTYPLAPLTCSLAPHCWLRLRAAHRCAHSFAHLFTPALQNSWDSVTSYVPESGYPEP